MFSEWIQAIWYLTRPRRLKLKNRSISLLWRHYDVIVKNLCQKNSLISFSRTIRVVWYLTRWHWLWLKKWSISRLWRHYDVIIKIFRPNNFRTLFSKSIRFVWYLTRGYTVMFILRAFFSIMTSSWRHLWKMLNL